MPENLPRIFVPSHGPTDWQALLAKPDRQWKTGFSAKTLAHCWEAANGLPREIGAIIQSSADFTNTKPELVVAFPEWQVPLPGGNTNSQSDVFALISAGDVRLAATVEGKVGEAFGPTIAEWELTKTDGRTKRLSFLLEMLELKGEPPSSVRYQLLHRSASALIEAKRFGAHAAAMIVHSFSPTSEWFGDFASYCNLFRIHPEIGKMYKISLPIPLYLGWAKGDPHFLTA